MPRNRLFWITAGVLVVILAISGIAGVRYFGTPEPASIAFSEFLTDLKAGRVQAVTVEADALSIQRKDGTTVEAVAPLGYVAANPTFITGLAESGVRVDVERTRPSRVGSISAIALALLFLGFAGLAVFRIVGGRVPTLE